MSGHNKWSQIRRQKGKTDAKKSQLFGKLGKLIAVEARKSRGNRESPGLKTAVERARAENMPSDSIERAIKKATGEGEATMETIIYEAYGPGGCALIIEALTSNKNKAAQEIKHILSDNGGNLAAQGAAAWAFQKTSEGWTAQTTVPLEDANVTALDKLVDALEVNEEVQAVYTNAE